MLSPLLALLGNLPSPTPKYYRYELYELVATTERVVAGTIVALQEKTFDLAVERDLFGNGGTELHLQRFFDWTCASRWAKYRVGQTVVLFLRGDGAMGAGDEGDWPMVDGRVLAPYRIHGREWTTKTFDGREVGGTPLTLDELASALTGYRTCFRAERESVDGRDQVRIEYALDAAAAEKFASGSTLAQHLCEETLSSRLFRGSEPAVIPPPLAVKPAIRACADGFCPPPDPEVTWVPFWDSEFGQGIASLGDVNGDGSDDLAVKGDELTVWTVLLDPAGKPLGRTCIEPRALGLNGFYFGQSLAGLGDFDADGVPDFAVGSPARKESASGRVDVLLLNRDGGVKKALRLSGNPLKDFGSSLGFGNTVASIGDLDGNGTIDLLVDVDLNSAGFDLERMLQQKEGPRHVLPLLYLDANASVVRLTSLPAEDIHGSPEDVTFGEAMTGIGDLDGDGLSEIAIGFPYDDDGGEYRGAVWIVFLARDGSLRAKTKLSDWSGNFESPLFDEDHFGSALAAPGDLDGDGAPDLIVAGEKELWILLLQRDGTVKRSRAFGKRSGGFVTVDSIRSLTVLHGPEKALRLAVGGVSEGGSENGDEKPKEAALWVMKLGPGPVLSAP